MKVKFLTPAEIELVEIIRYYERQQLRLGVQFRSELKQTLTRIMRSLVAYISAYSSMPG
jgi:hypothetical protein